MKYKDARPHIKTGDLLAWSHKGLKSWYDFQVMMVRAFTRSEYSHVGIAVVLNRRVFILEAVSSGVRLFPLSRELPFYWIKRPEPLPKQSLEYGFQQIGAPYESKWQMVLAALTGKSLNGNKRMQCSELVKNIYQIDVEETPTAIVQWALEYWGPLEYVDA